ncbi:MAG: YqaJ viral recombinase family protein [Halieaceae bacterium]|nr:YqaJ viral recombinase family protein [Halieaceae bacterium]
MALSEEHARIKNETIGSSDIAALFNESPFAQPMDVYLRLIGEKPAVANEEYDDDDPRALGSEFEDVLRQRYLKRLATELQVNPEQFVVRVPDAPMIHRDLCFVSSTPDIMVAISGQGSRCGEMKLCFFADRSEWGEEMTDQIPPHYLLQCHHHMLVTRTQVCDLFAWFGRTDFRLYVVQFDPDIAAMIEETCLDFWTRNVEEREPPELVFGHRRTQQILRELYPGTNGEHVELPQEAVHYHRTLQDIQRRIGDLTKARDALKEQVQEWMGEHAVGYIPGETKGAYIRKKEKRKAYTVEPTEFVTMRFSPQKNRPKED